MYRIYDAAFAATTGTEHEDLGTFWWEETENDRQTGRKGQWTRLGAHDFVANHQLGYVFVREGNYKVNVKAYHNNITGTKWIRTEADGIVRDNLVTLARRHRQGLLNN